MTDNLNYKLNAPQRAKTKRIVGKVLIYLALVIFAIWILAPFSIVIMTSFKTWQEATDPEFSFFPKEFTFQGYKEVFTYTASAGDFPMPVMLRGFINTLIIIIPPTILGLFCSAISAYAFAKLRFKGKNLLFGFLLLTMMIPGTIMLTPSYMIYDMIGWTDTPLPLMIPGMFGAATCVFFMRQFYSGIPTELIEAAKLDGMGYFKIFWKIMVPLSVPALFAQGLLRTLPVLAGPRVVHIADCAQVFPGFLFEQRADHHGRLDCRAYPNACHLRSGAKLLHRRYRNKRYEVVIYGDVTQRT